MVRVLAAVTTDTGLRIGLVGTAFGFGFRHGIDWDHLAALTDITGSQATSRRSMLLATLYALGHALVVFVLGVLAIGFSEQLPGSVDGVMERVVGATLVALGCYVVWSLVRHGRDFRMRSRWMLLLAGLRSGARRWRARVGGGGEVVVIEHEHEHPVGEPHEHDDASLHAHVGGHVLLGTGAGSNPPVAHRHRHVVAMPDDPFVGYGRASAFGVGMLHGVGAETPTQVLLFVTAAGVGDVGAGLLLLVCFLVGLLVSNSVVALASTFGFLGASRNFGFYATVSVLTAVCSLAIGSLLVLGRGSLLPAFFGG